jgi:type IV secretion system protein VirB11
MRPDRVILGEIRGSAAVTVLRAVNTRHPGSISTILAGSLARTIDQMAPLVLQQGARMAWGDVVKYVRDLLEIIKQLSRVGGKRDLERVCLVD